MKLFQQLFQLGFPFRPTHAFAGFEDGHDVVPHGQFAKHGGLLGQVTDALAGAPMHWQRGDVLGVDGDPAVIRRHQAHDHVEAGGLAGAVGAEQADNLAGANFQRNVQHHFFLLVAFCQITGPENCHPNLSRHWIELNYEAESPFPPGRSRRRMACRLPQ